MEKNADIYFIDKDGIPHMTYYPWPFEGSPDWPSDKRLEELWDIDEFLVFVDDEIREQWRRSGLDVE